MKNKQGWHLTVFYCIIFILLPLLIGILMYARAVRVLHRYVERQVTAQAAILEEMASQRLSSRLEELERVAGYFRNGAISEDRMGNAIESLLDNPGQKSKGILRLDGTPVIGNALLPSEYPAVQNAFRGKSTVRYRYGEGMLFTTPIFNNGNVKYALYEFFDEKALFESFGENFYANQGRVMLADYTQELLIPILEDDGLQISFFQQDDIKKAIDRLALEMNSTRTAAAYCRHPNGRDFLFVSDMVQTDLYLMGMIPYEAAAAGISGFSATVVLVFGLLLLLLAIGTFRVVSSEMKARESEELRHAKQIAEEASKSKSDFLAKMSHELRTPINTIMGMNEMILRETNELETRERAMDIMSASKILLGLINDVLDFSKIESRKLNIVPVEYSLTSLIRDLTLLCENRAREKSLKYQVFVQPNLPLALKGDDVRIRQVLSNLLTNAVKYTPKGQVSLKVTGRKKDENMIVLHWEVADTGIGFREEDLPRLFTPYLRLEEARNHYIEGTGLGLPIIINLLRLMGSELKVESVHDKGSTFYFDLEQKIADPTPIGDINERMAEMVRDYEYRAAFTAPRAQILMVDDNAMNRKLFASLLKQTLISVTTVSGGEKCLDIVTRQHFDLIFMDHLMPEMDGVETLRRMKELDGNLCKDTPVVALTANAFTGARERYISLGFSDFLPKPIAAEKLEIMIRNLLPAEYLEEPTEEAGADASNKPDTSKLAPGITPEMPEPEKLQEPENEPGSEEFPEITGVNWDFARLHIEDREILMDTVLDYYEELDSEYEAAAAMAQNPESMDEAALTRYRVHVHSLKSTSALVGILSVSELARLLETAARNQDRERIRLLNPILLDEMMKMKERLSDWVKKR